MSLAPAFVAALLMFAAAPAAPPTQLRWLVADLAAPELAAIVALDANDVAAELPVGLRIELDGVVVSPTRRGCFLEIPLPRGARSLRALAPGLPEARRELPSPPERRSVGLAVEPAAPVKGRDLEATVQLEVRAPDGSVDVAARPPLLVASGGTLSPLVAVGPGRFSARWLLPTRRAPEVAVLVAFVPWPHDDAPSGSLGALRVPLATAIELPGHAERAGVEVTARLGGMTFGPVRTGPDGRFQLPVVVPPGASRASGETHDRGGLRQSFPIELGLPEMPRLACVAAPAHRVAGGRVPLRVACAASEADGRPADRAALRARADGIAPRPLVAIGGGLFELSIAPGEPLLGAPRLVVEFPAAGPASSVVLERPLAAGLPASLEAAPSEAPAIAGGMAEVTLLARDSSGAPVEGARVRLADPPGVEGRTDRTGHVRIAMPAGPKAGLRELSFEARPGTSGAPARVRLHREGAALVASVSDAEGRPVRGAALDGGGVTDADGVARLPIGPIARGFVEHEVRLADNALVGGRLVEVPLPDEAKLIWPGLDLASAMNSFTVFAGTEGCTSITLGTRAISATVARSRCRE